MNLAAVPLDPHLRCLLLLARPRLQDAHATRLRTLLADPACDHAALVTLARAHHLSLLCEAHLRAHAPGALKAAAAETLSRECAHLRLRQMERLRVQAEVLRVLGELAEPHAVLKGSVLAVRHYADPLHRQGRDVDVLVESTGIAPAVQRLQEQDYSIISEAWPRVVPACLDALAAYTTAVELRSPSGIIVELHRLVDHSGCVFPVGPLLRERTEASLFGRSIPALDPAADVLYSLFHHARHQWTLLHWVADLQAFAPMLRQTGLQARADRHGLRVTVQRSLELAREVDALALDPAGLQHPSDFLEFALPPWRETATEHEKGQEPDFRMRGQKSWRYRACFQVCRLRPTLDDYLAWPLPRRWRWLYYLSKPVRVLARAGRGGPAS